MAEKHTVKDGTYALKLGKSMEANGSTSFHSMRYDFKPASVDTSKPAKIDIGENNHVTVTVPHSDGSATQETVYQGNKRPCQKECILIIDHVTNEFTLEKLTYNMQLKTIRANKAKAPPTRPPVNPDANRPITPAEKAKPLKKAPAKRKSSKQNAAAIVTTPQVPEVGNDQVVATTSHHEIGNAVNGKTLSDEDGSSSSSNSSTDDSSESDDDDPPEKIARPTNTQSPALNLLNSDLQLSDSGEDSS